MNSINNEQLDITLQQEVNDDMNSTNKKTILKYVQEHLSQKWDENPTYLIAKGVGGVASIAAIIYLIIKHQERQRYAAMMSHMTTDKHSKHVIIYIIIGTLVFIVLIILFSRMFCSRVETKSLDGTVSIQRRTVPRNLVCEVGQPKHCRQTFNDERFRKNNEDENDCNYATEAAQEIPNQENQDKDQSSIETLSTTFKKNYNFYLFILSGLNYRKNSKRFNNVKVIRYVDPQTHDKISSNVDDVVLGTGTTPIYTKATSVASNTMNQTPSDADIRKTDGWTSSMVTDFIPSIKKNSPPKEPFPKPSSKGQTSKSSQSPPSPKIPSPNIASSCDLPRNVEVPSFIKKPVESKASEPKTSTTTKEQKQESKTKTN
ncbi:hypothetical protein BLOT_002518 [Blomia tropicalis]|nr:hypothetical protein BLOT_002518 [Blomia tropicalis]